MWPILCKILKCTWQEGGKIPSRQQNVPSIPTLIFNQPKKPHDLFVCLINITQKVIITDISRMSSNDKGCCSLRSTPRASWLCYTMSSGCVRQTEFTVQCFRETNCPASTRKTCGIYLQIQSRGTTSQHGMLLISNPKPRLDTNKS